MPLDAILSHNSEQIRSDNREVNAYSFWTAALLRGTSLLELLRFLAEKYVSVSKELHDLHVVLYIEESETESVPAVLDFDTTVSALAKLNLTKIICEEIGLQVCVKHTDELIAKLNQKILAADDLRALQENLERELSCHFFVGIAEDRVSAFMDGRKGWEDILKVFPDASDDVEEMNKCYALCRYSAAVFHSLLVMEHGLVRLGPLIGATDRKEGWDASCKKLAEIVKAGGAANATGIDYSFLEQLNTSIQSIKLAWRNKVNHATGKPVVMGGGFAPYACEEIISATRSFTRILAEGILKHEEETRIRRGAASA
jgi:hypothetical protein